MNLSYIDKWILTNIYDNYIHDNLQYNELYNEDEYQIINEDNDIIKNSSI